MGHFAEKNIGQYILHFLIFLQAQEMHLLPFAKVGQNICKTTKKGYHASGIRI